ncbi:MAG: right-handed parallel beta-helix repeat-containing protein [Victivallales bacterium]|nr:right-handed parallel beta-helix repeat-containing protein [Victivallales bacterium]
MRRFPPPHAAALCLILFTQVGSLAVADEAETVFESDFETGDASGFVAKSHLGKVAFTKDAKEVVAGARSLRGDSMKGGSTWNEVLVSSPGLLKAKEAYLITLDYRVLARQGDAQFYALFRRPRGGKGNTGWQDWQGKPGDTGTVEAKLHTGGAADWSLILGIKKRGTIAIDNVRITTDPDGRPASYPLPIIARTWESPGKTSYYVDSKQGNDASAGTTPEQAWKTLTKVNQGTFAADDRILLKRGSAWTSALTPGGQGQPGAPIVVEPYGDGPKPQIDPQGKLLAAVYLHNVSHLELRGLDIANNGRQRQAGRRGVLMQLENFGTASGIVLSGLHIHDVTGSNVKKAGGGSGIMVRRKGTAKKSRYDGLLIENCLLERVDRNGINMAGYWTRKEWYPNLNVVIRKNRIVDFGGDGIVPIGCDGALVEHNVLSMGRQRCRDAAAGVWPWSCDNTLVQFNEVSGMKGKVDGQGFDSDWNCRNTVFQYNYSHDNEGGFMLVCNNGASKMPNSIGNIGTVIRYNISQNDMTRTFHISGPCRDTFIYGNTIYIGPEQKLPIIKPGNWGGDWPENTVFTNNIFHVAGEAQFEFKGMRKNVFRNNVFFGKIGNIPEGEGNLTVDPGLVGPGSGGDGIDSLGGYRLRPDSPCRKGGIPIDGPGKRDFFGNPLAPAAPSIGAHQTP